MKHRLGLAAAVVIGVVGLSGCQTSQLGAAAIVDGQRIKVSEIESTLDHIRDQRAQHGLSTDLGPDAARGEVQRRVLDLVYERAASDLGITITDADVQATRDADSRSDAELADLAAQNNVSVDNLDDLFRRFTFEKKISDLVDKQFPGASEEKLNTEFSNRLESTARELNIRINPRYGTFDPVVGQINPLEPDYLKAP